MNYSIIFTEISFSPETSGLYVKGKENISLIHCVLSFLIFKIPVFNTCVSGCNFIEKCPEKAKDFTFRLIL